MRSLIRALLLLIVIVAIGFFAFGWWTGRSVHSVTNQPADTPAATAGTVESARERGAELGEKAATATAKLQAAAAESEITAKIKAKMALDDYVKARSIDVTTNGSTVTLGGTVGSKEEHDRAVKIARETEGVARVVDHLEIR